ncbi:YiiX/YebB-like N1pC/P60 family cysteine hydrolase [Aquabacterium sp. A08]|uniref:YiiX/YebB-like N1pC/P60 family cysteine hydrolase n=1 Tax=Aquabacterium sp. A08 TaxID=2718532 RepID=UPI0014221041|nr:hypothetical protein [Aquabacterium sp. A08]
MDELRPLPRRQALAWAAAAGGLGLGAAWLGLVQAPAQATPARAAQALAPLQAGNVAGNLLFRGTRSLEGRVVRWFDDASDYTHVGVMVPASSGGWSVVHATPDGQAVVREPLAAFVSHPGSFLAASFGWAPATGRAPQALAELVSGWIGRPFDGDFDSQDPQRLYCTELVWAAAQALGWVGPPALHTLQTPLGPKQVITVSHLLQRLPLVPTWAGPLA